MLEQISSTQAVGPVIQAAASTKTDYTALKLRVGLLPASVRLNEPLEYHSDVLCPFHDEDTASFGAFPHNKTGLPHFKCFGCGWSGDIIDFVQKFDHVEPKEAIKKLNETDVSDYVSPAPSEKKPFKAAEFLSSLNELKPLAGSLGEKYLVGRGIAPDVAQEFKLGYAPSVYIRCASSEKCANCGEVPALIIPKFADGTLIGIKKRALNPKDKDHKWSQVSGSASDYIYGADAEPVNNSGTVLVFEGALDALLARSYGFNAVAVESSSSVPEHKPSERFQKSIDLLKEKYKVIALAGDQGETEKNQGVAAMSRLQKLIGEKSVLVDLKLPDGLKDIGQLYEHYKQKNLGDDPADEFQKHLQSVSDSLRPEQIAEPEPQSEFDVPQISNTVESVQPAVVEESADPNHTLTPEEYETEMEKEFPVIPLRGAPGPTWDDDIMYGIAGDIVRKASEFCEAHPAGMYLDLLVSFGSIIGRGPYFNVSSTQHHANEFIVRVGESSVSRKGTGRDTINEVLKLVDRNWYQNRVMSGFGSAEAIVNEIRDESVQQVRDRKGGGFKPVAVPGIQDKRLMIREGELASIFQLAGKPESRADVVLRDGWDGQPLHNIVKGKTDGLSNSNSCRLPYISISADTTRDELIRKMPDGAAKNGFANRFLYCYVRRVKMCPNGGPRIDWTNEVTALQRASEFGGNLEYVGVQKSTWKVWNRMYPEIENDVQRMPQLAGAMCLRAVAHAMTPSRQNTFMRRNESGITAKLPRGSSFRERRQIKTRYFAGWRRRRGQ